MYTTNCSYCSSLLCEGCKQHKMPPFTGFKPQYYFKTTDTSDTEQHWIAKIFKGMDNIAALND